MSKQKYILVAEDDLFLGKAYTAKLEKAGFKVLVVTDGKQALESLEKEIPDVLLLDLIMPVMDGFTVLEEMKKNPKFRSIPVIVASNLGQDEDVARSKNLGADEYVIKSNMSLDGLIQKINTFAK